MTQLSQRIEVIKEPGKSWKNKWRLLQAFPAKNCAEIYPAGLTYWTEAEFPSRDTAETRAAEIIAHNLKTCAVTGDTPPEYLGAFESDSQ